MVRIVGNPPPPEAIVRATMFEELRTLRDTDTGNAEAFELLYRHRFRYNHSRKRWMVWNGIRWTPDTDGEAQRQPSTQRAGELQPFGRHLPRRKEKRPNARRWAISLRRLKGNPFVELTPPLKWRSICERSQQWRQTTTAIHSC